MAGFIKSDVERAETAALNTKINKEIFDDFKGNCKYLGYPMNVLLETFMRQYTNERFDICHDDIIKWKKDDSEMDTLNTTFNKEIYANFKNHCKDKGYFVKHVITAFMENFSKKNFIMEFVELIEDE